MTQGTRGSNVRKLRREEKGSEGKRREEKGRKGKKREEKGRKGKKREEKGRDLQWYSFRLGSNHLN